MDGDDSGDDSGCGDNGVAGRLSQQLVRLPAWESNQAQKVYSDQESNTSDELSLGPHKLHVQNWLQIDTIPTSLPTLYAIERFPPLALTSPRTARYRKQKTYNLFLFGYQEQQSSMKKRSTRGYGRWWT
jgi:hypothetical protein